MISALKSHARSLASSIFRRSHCIHIAPLQSVAIPARASFPVDESLLQQIAEARRELVASGKNLDRKQEQVQKNLPAADVIVLSRGR